MTPTLESVLFASPTVAMSINRLSRDLAEEAKLFRNSTLNTTVIFKYPNFDAAQDPSGDIIPGLEDLVESSKQNPVRTAIYVPKDAADLRIGGFGLFTDDEKFKEQAERYIGLKIAEEAAAEDVNTLRILENCPSLDPFLVREAFDLAEVEVDNAYVSISDVEARQVRDRIQMKVRPIVAKALGISHEGRIEKTSREFLETIWDPSASSGSMFISAFGIDGKDAPKVFSSWKGVAFFDNEFNIRQTDFKKLTAWLKSDLSMPVDYAKLTQAEKQQLDMFRKSVTQKIKNVSLNITAVLGKYQLSYDNFIQHDRPSEFRRFLIGAEQYYWTLGGCNGVLAQVVNTWRRYMQTASAGRLNFDVLDRLYKVCDAILRSRSDDKQIAL